VDGAAKRYNPIIIIIIIIIIIMFVKYNSDVSSPANP
jgi:hypothetical protein